MKDKPWPLFWQWVPATKRHEWVETEPDACPTCGAPWAKPGSMQRGYRPCGVHRGHRMWTCRGCGADVVNRTSDVDCD